MSPGDLRQYLLAKPEALEDCPFGPRVFVFKVRSGCDLPGYRALGAGVEARYRDAAGHWRTIA